MLVRPTLWEAAATTGEPIEDLAIKAGPSRVMLSGMCRLEFEDQFFFPDDEPTRQCWLAVEPAVRDRVGEMLGPDWYPDLDEFHATFWGTLCWTPDGCGHLGGSKSWASMDELISAQIVRHRPPSTEKKYGSLRKLLRAHRAATK